jgi:hypothetical protein
MHNIKEGHDVKAFVGDMLVHYAEAFKKTKRPQKNKNNIIYKKNKLFLQIQNAGKRNYQIP